MIVTCKKCKSKGLFLFLDGIVCIRKHLLSHYLCQIKIASKPRTLLIGPSDNYIEIIMYRLFTFQKLRGHSKTTWTKKGINVPSASVGSI